MTQGVNKESRPKLKVVSKCARYTETGLKMIASLDTESDEREFVTVQKEQIQQLCTVFTAQINFLQSEYAKIIVKSKFDEETSHIFRSFENNSGAFTDRSLQNIPAQQSLPIPVDEAQTNADVAEVHRRVRIPCFSPTLEAVSILILKGELHFHLVAMDNIQRTLNNILCVVNVSLEC